MINLKSFYPTLLVLNRKGPNFSNVHGFDLIP